MTQQNGGQPMRLREFFDVAVRVTALLMPLALVAGGYLTRSVLDHETRISVIESNRFTSKDGQLLRKEIEALVAPAWLREDIAEIKAMLRDLDARVRKIENRGQ